MTDDQTWQPSVNYEPGDVVTDSAAAETFEIGPDGVGHLVPRPGFQGIIFSLRDGVLRVRADPEHGAPCYVEPDGLSIDLALLIGRLYPVEPGQLILLDTIRIGIVLVSGTEADVRWGDLDNEQIAQRAHYARVGRVSQRNEETGQMFLQAWHPARNILRFPVDP